MWKHTKISLKTSWKINSKTSSIHNSELLIFQPRSLLKRKELEIKLHQRAPEPLLNLLQGVHPQRESSLATKHRNKLGRQADQGEGASRWAMEAKPIRLGRPRNKWIKLETNLSSLFSKIKRKEWRQLNNNKNQRLRKKYWIPLWASSRRRELNKPKRFKISWKIKLDLRRASLLPKVSPNPDLVQDRHFRNGNRYLQVP